MTGAAPQSARARGVFLAVVLLVAFGLRAGVVRWLSDTVPYTDFALYHVAGAEIARDPGFLFDADAARQLPQLNWWPPGYPTFLGSIYALFGTHHRNAVWIQVLLGVATCVFVYGFARRIADERIARMTAILVALNPTYIFLTNQLASENLYMFWLALGLWMLMEFIHQARSDESGESSVRAIPDTPSRRALAALAFGTGVVLGLGALTRAVGLVVPVVLGAWMWRRVPKVPHQINAVSGIRRRHIAWMLAGVALTLAPWSVRNALVVGSPAIVSFGGGLNFYFGHNERSIGYQDVAASELGTIRDPAELDRRGYALGLQFIAQHPAQDLANAARKLSALYGFPDYALHANSGILVPDVRAHPERADEALARLERQRSRDHWLHGPLTVVARTYFVLLLVGAGLSFLCWRALPSGGRLGVQLGVWLVVSWTLVHVVYWAQPRFRAPVEIPLALLAAVSVAWLVQRLRNARALARGPTA